MVGMQALGGKGAKDAHLHTDFLLCSSFFLLLKRAAKFKGCQYACALKDFTYPQNSGTFHINIIVSIDA